MVVPLKETYTNEVKQLSREQYKRSPKYINSMIAVAGKITELEKAIHNFYSINSEFGITSDSPRDVLLKTAKMFSIKTDGLTNAQIINELTATKVLLQSKGLIKDIKLLIKSVYNYNNDIQDVGDGIYISVQGNISLKEGFRGRLLFNYISRMLPAGVKLHGLIEKRNNFAFLGYPRASEFRNEEDLNVVNNGFNEITINSKGVYIAK